MKKYLIALLTFINFTFLCSTPAVSDRAGVLLYKDPGFIGDWIDMCPAFAPLNSDTGRCEVLRYVYYLYNRTWNNAQSICESNNGHLVVYSSAGEESGVESMLSVPVSDWYWIGFNDIDQEGNWVWVNGEPVNYTNWRSGEPNNGYGNEDCATGNFYGPQWCDWLCDNDMHIHTFVCEYNDLKISNWDSNHVCPEGFTPEVRNYADRRELWCVTDAA